MSGALLLGVVVLIQMKVEVKEGKIFQLKCHSRDIKPIVIRYLVPKTLISLPIIPYILRPYAAFSV